MTKYRKYVGLDTHKDMIAVAVDGMYRPHERGAACRSEAGS